MPRALVIAAIAFTGTMLGSLSGGSTSLLTTPSWVALGFPLPAAIGADKIAGAFWTLLGSRNYLRRSAPDRRLALGMVIFGLGGVVLGTLATANLPPGPLQRVVGGIIVAVVIVVALRPRLGVEAGPPRLSRRATVAASVPFGFYEGLLGSGNSIFVTLLLAGGRGLDLPRALGHYYLVASAWCAVAAISYAAQGFFEPRLAVPATLGAIAGGYLGSRIGARRGAPFVKVVFVLAGVILGGKLLLGR
jgi:uncharacterized protein